MEAEPFITIGIASYNYAAYLRRAFEAIKRQAFRDFEVLYCDDGSTDDSVAVIRALIRENPEMTIRLVEGKNGGVMANKNRILDNARGRYIMLCDADDWMEDDCLQVLAEAARKSDADRIVSVIRKVDENGHTLKIQEFGPCPSKWVEALHHGALYKRAVIKENGLRFVKAPDDFCFIEEFNIYAQKTEFVNKSVYNWYIHSDSTSSGGGARNAWKGAKILEGVMQYYQKLKPQVKKQDLDVLEAEVIKYYYHHMLSSTVECASWADVTQLYQTMQTIMREGIPSYIKNQRIRNCKNSCFRPGLARALFCLTVLDETHTLGVVLHLLWLKTNRKKKCCDAV